MHWTPAVGSKRKARAQNWRKGYRIRRGEGVLRKEGE
jgi:hypothetical protein